MELREGGVVDEVEEGGGDHDHQDQDQDGEAEGAAAYAAAASPLGFGLERGWQHGLSRGRWRWFGVRVPGTGGFL